MTTTDANSKAVPGGAEALISRWGAASVCAVTFLAYVGTARFQFVHDDRGQIVGNPAVHSWQSVPSYFTGHVWAAVASGSYLANDYRPLFLLWVRINDAIFGGHAAGWHLSTVLMHVAATYCVILLAGRVMKDHAEALIAGLIFGLHPIHIEAVAWISGVPEPMLAVLLIPSYLCWLNSRQRAQARGRWMATSLALYAMSLLTKETAVVLLLIVFCSAWLGFPPLAEPRDQGLIRRFLKSCQAAFPYFLLTVAYVIARTLALKGFSHPAAQINPLTMVLTWPSLLVFYLKLLLWPVGLSPFYGLRFVFFPGLRNTLVPALALLLSAVGLWQWARNDRAIALAIPWFILPVLPVLDVQVLGNGNFAHNRYLYLPSVGFTMLAAAALSSLKTGKPLYGEIPSMQVWVAGMLALAMLVAVQVEDRYYANDLAFYAYGYQKLGGHDPIIGMDYANALAEQGDFQHAAAIYQELITEHSEMWNAYFNLGYMDYQQGQIAQSLVYLAQAAKLAPAKADPIFFLGLANFKLNRQDDAEADLRRAIELAPAAPNYHFALGVVLRVRGKLPEALTEFSQEIQLNPGQEAAEQQAAEIQKQLEGTR